MTADASNRKYKDSVFRMIFTIPEYAADLYQGLKNMPVPENKIIFEETGGLLISELNHDVAFRVGNTLVLLFEHQSTLNENMPVRFLIDIAELYARYIRTVGETAIYRKSLIKLPAPEFYVFYNGAKDSPKEQTMLLSDAFGKDNNGMLELKATFINIKFQENVALLQKSKMLNEYSRFVYYVEQERNSGVQLGAAIKTAIKKCLNENILKDFLSMHQKEVEIAMTMEYNRDAENAAFKEEGREKTLIESVHSLMETTKWTAQQAMDALKIPPQEREKILAAI